MKDTTSPNLEQNRKQSYALELLNAAAIENESDSFSSSSPCSYLEFYVRVLYCLCIVPYYPKRNGEKGLTLSKIWIQQILCGCVHLLILLHQLQIIISTLQEDVMSTPLKVVPLAFAVSDSLYVIFWVYTFWRKNDHIQKLIVEMSTSKSFVEMKPWILKLKCILFTLLPFVCLTFTVVHQGFPDALSNSFFFISNNNNNNTITENGFNNASLDDDERNLVVKHYYKMAIKVSGIPWLLILQCVETLVLLLAISTFEITSSYVKGAERLRDQAIKESGESAPHANLFKKYILIARKLKSYFASLNDFSSGFYFAWFCMIVPWLSFRILETLRLEDFPYTFIFNWTFIIIFMIILGCCAESRRQVEQFQSIVEDYAYQQSSILEQERMSTLKYVKYAIRHCGVEGGRFFHFSYGFVGNTIGLIIAYSLLFIQFHGVDKQTVHFL